MSAVRVLVAPDKFKGTLSAAQVADAIAIGLEATPGIRCTRLALADGGDGSVAAALSAGFAKHLVEVDDANGVRHQSPIAFDGATAVVEVANTCGIALLPRGELQPMSASSIGFGQAVRAALKLRPATVVLALGGSCSTDGGLGLLSALGARITDRAGAPVSPCGGRLDQIAHIDLGSIDLGSPDLRNPDLGNPDLGNPDLRNHDRLGLARSPIHRNPSARNGRVVRDGPRVRWIVASDVDAVLHGPHGAARLFAPQKGASPEQVNSLDRGLRRVADLCGPRGHLAASTPGAGAAGGLGFAALLLGAEMRSGAEFFLDLLGFDNALADSDIVITGEGCIDDSTLRGKLPYVVAQRAAPRPVYAVVGRNEISAGSTLGSAFHQIHQVGNLTAADTRQDPQLTTRILTEIGRKLGPQLTRQ